MPSLNFATGYKTFDLNGDGTRTISFNPTDPAFVERINDAMTRLEHLNKDYRERAAKLKIAEEILGCTAAADKDVRTAIDGAFGEPVADKAFGATSCFALAGGLPLWCNFMIAIIEQCGDAMAVEHAATNPRLQALLGKYKRK